MLYLIIISCIIMIAMMVFAVYAHDKSYDVPHIDPDPMEFRVQNIKTRIDEVERKIERHKHNESVS